MNEIQLRYFCTLAKTEHLNHAAEELFISPSSLSITIRRIEAELGVPLFEKRGRNIVLTHYGKLFLPKAHSVLGILEDARKELGFAKSNDNNSVVIMGGSISAFPELLSAILRNNQSVSFERSMLVSKEDLLLRILSRKIDMYIGSIELENSLLKKQLLFKEHNFLVVSRFNPLANKKGITVADLSEQSFAVCSDNTVQKYFFDSFCSTAGFKPKIAAICSSTRMIIETTVIDPTVIGMLPERLLSIDAHAGQLVNLDLAFENPLVSVCLYCSNDNYERPATKQIWDIIVDFFKDNTI